jgi:hypothetical protein
VSCSRGRKSATVFTDDKAALRALLLRSEEQLAARELVARSSARKAQRIRKRQKDEERRRLDLRLMLRAARGERQHER